MQKNNTFNLVCILSYCTSQIQKMTKKGYQKHDKKNNNKKKKAKKRTKQGIKPLKTTEQTNKRRNY